MAAHALSEGFDKLTDTHKDMSPAILDAESCIDWQCTSAEAPRRRKTY